MLARIGAAMEKTRVQPSLCSICSYILPIVSCGSPRRSCSLSPRSIGAVRPVATGVAGARAVGSRSETATKDIGRLTTLGKIKVSRAVRGLEARGIVSRISESLRSAGADCVIDGPRPRFSIAALCPWRSSEKRRSCGADLR
jgi:hypothetical protein